MPMPDLDPANRKKPLCYDPLRKKFIYYDEIVSQKEKIVSPGTLSKADQKRLVIERQLAGPDYKTQAMSGRLMTRRDVVRAIKRNEPSGIVTVEAEISYLGELLKQIEQNLK